VIGALAAAACASKPEPVVIPVRLPPPVERSLPHAIIVASGEPDGVSTLVMASSAEEADAARGAVLNLYAQFASAQGKWGMRVAPEWREASPEETMAAMSEDSPEGGREELIARIGERFGKSHAYVLDVTFIEEPVEVVDGTVYSAADLMAAQREPGATAEN
jgi:hypothetical protein